MTRILDKFIKSVKNLEDYYILQECGAYLAIGTQITIKKHHEVLNNVFQPYSRNVDINLHVIFIVPLKKESSELEEFKKRKVPVLTLSKKVLYGKDETFSPKDYLDDFVDNKIKNSII